MHETSKRDFQPAAEKFGTLWCIFIHDSPMWPIHGQYECRTCGRHYLVPWTENESGRARVIPVTVESGPAQQARLSYFRPVLLPLVLLLAIVFASPVRAADLPIVDPTSGAGMAFARYAAGLATANSWDSETIEIDATLSKLAKHGHLRAIRRLVPFGKPEYQVLELGGDQTVTQQVIVRYLSAEVRAATMPASSVAITPANYNFHYKGAVKTGDTVAYAFQITPRQKREGLIKGELWLDGETGAIVRESGYLVKRPSIFVKRVDVTREIILRNGFAEIRLTHLSIDTRLVGLAELIIQEHPYAAPDSGRALSIED